MRLRMLIVGLLMALGLQACEQPYVWNATEVSGAMPDLEFALIGPDENQVDAQSLLGKPVFLFFGFTHCPDVCPTTLTQLKIIIDKLGDDADKIQVLLVTVDPERDTPAVMKAYTGGFGPWLLGLTGPEENIDALRDRYNVYSSMESHDEHGGYNVMHTPAVFVFDADGKARLLFTDVTDSDAVVSDIQQLIK